MIAWLDLETTGLDKNAPASGILEIAFVMTDDDLNELGSIELVTKPVAHCLDWVEQLHPRVLEMHTKNGLIKDVRERGIRRYEAEAKLLEFLVPIIGDEKGKVPLGGASVHFDGDWIGHFMSPVRELFSHRIIDVTTLSLCADRWAKKVRENRPRQAEGSEHRAMADIRYSIECARYYRHKLFNKPMCDTYPLVIVESPYAPNVPKPTGACECTRWNHAMCDFHAAQEQFDIQLKRNVDYARAAMKDCLLRGESPYASHLLYTQVGVLDDTIPAERNHGIHAGFAWRQIAEKTVVYNDLGISKGMEYGIADAKKRGCPVEYRSLPNWRK